MKKMMLIMLLAVAGCASNDAPTRPPTQDAAVARPQTIGYSVQGRPIELHTLVKGDRPVLVMGAIHGDETTSENVSRGLLNELRRDPKLASGVPLVIIPVANPDGLAAKTRTNVNNIDVNRNFPSKNFHERTPGRTFRGGTTPASEPETRALIETINRLQPRLIITVHSIRNGEECNNYDGPAQHIAELMTRYNGYPPKANIGYPTPGSLGNWGGNDRQIPMITLELPRTLPAERAWPDNRSAVLAAIAAMK
jgi:hypothetical protein